MDPKPNYLDHSVASYDRHGSLGGFTLKSLLHAQGKTNYVKKSEDNSNKSVDRAYPVPVSEVAERIWGTKMFGNNVERKME